jgi:hypothetical protein
MRYVFLILNVVIISILFSDWQKFRRKELLLPISLADTKAPQAEELLLIIKRAEALDGTAEYQLGMYELAIRGHYERAKFWFEKAANHGEPRAKQYLSEIEKFLSGSHSD